MQNNPHRSITCHAGADLSTTLVLAGGGLSFEGTFYNSEYDVRGTIHVTVGGNRQTARLTSDSGTASLELRR